MARPGSLIIVVLLALAATSCRVNGRMYPPQYETPATRLEAATMLHGALMEGVPSMRNISVNEDAMHWEEAIQRRTVVEPSPRQFVWRTLLFRHLRGYTYPKEDQGDWIIRLFADGGNVTLVFKDADAAGRAEAALRVLSLEGRARRTE
ncbi:MAG: hypothetical protein IT462_13560 [Planctomycetes bacterium]|nr:hypothetical protein [Planctomycetota bacterium]